MSFLPPFAESVQIKDKIWLVAMKPITKGEEITYDYCYTQEDYEENPCHCGHPECIGYILHKRHRKKLKKLGTYITISLLPNQENTT